MITGSTRAWYEVRGSRLQGNRQGPGDQAGQATSAIQPIDGQKVRSVQGSQEEEKEETKA